MYVSRAASRAAPAVLRAGVRTAGRPVRNTPRHIPAIAILIPHRGLATETSTSARPGAVYPPPGFNTEQAKKPLPKEEQQKPKEKSSPSSLPDISIPKDAPTSHPKTAATEAQSLTELAMGKPAGETTGEKKAVSMKDEEKQKKTLWQKIKHEAQHYWDGTKLLVVEVKISSKLALKMAAGYELTRREHRQVLEYGEIACTVILNRGS
jgi:LETM1 and EF-hand domain-containing protein 1